MVVQFHCPMCLQPVEVDEEWAGQHVCCPYCQRVVTAPTQSTLRAEDLASGPVARKLSAQRGAAARASRAPALTDEPRRIRLAAVGLVVSLLAVFLFLLVNTLTARLVFRELGPSATPEEAQTKLLEILLAPDAGAVRAMVMILMFLSFACWIAGLCLSIIALSRRQPRGRRLAVTGLICSGLLPFFILLGTVLSL